MVTTTMAQWGDWLWSELFDDEAGDGRPVTILHVDDNLFARSAARAGLMLEPSAARSLFLGVFPPRFRVQRWLTGSEKPEEALLPLLILCCLAASEAADSDENDFRRRLRDLMGWDLVITHCDALPKLWRRLARMTVKRSETTLTRPLKLPDPRFRTQIGHAIELTFPSRNDTRRLLSDLGSGGFDLESPRAVLDWLAPLVERGGFSGTFEETFDSFRSAWLQAERALADHRFWSGWRLVTAQLRAAAESGGFEILVDEWGAHRLVDPESGAPLDLEQALADHALSSRLVVAATRGHMIPLIERDWGRLRWAGERAGTRPQAALVRERAFRSRLGARTRAAVAGADGWALIHDLDGLDGRGEGVDRDRLLDLAPSQFWRVDGAILARPALPFVVEVSGLVESLRLEGDLADRLMVTEVGSGRWLLTPREPLDGEVDIVVEPRRIGPPLRRRLRLRRAILVPAFRDPPERLFNADPPPTPAWPRDARHEEIASGAEPGGEAVAPALLDLTEALAVKTGTMPLADVFAICRQVVGDAKVSPWDVIRALGDAGMLCWLEARGVRGRSALPLGPRGAITRVGAVSRLTLEGVLSETFLARLDAASARLDLKRETRAGVSGWSPPTECVWAAEASALLELAQVLDLEVGYLRASPDPLSRWRIREPLARGREDGEGRSVPLASRHAPLRHVAFDRLDIGSMWEVEGRGGPRHWRDREDAILDAYAEVDERPFTVAEGRLRAIDARLPIHFARWVRLLTATASGPLEDGYGYACDAIVERAARAIHPAILASASGERRHAPADRSRRWRTMATMNNGEREVRPSWRVAREGI
ncbi:hypothetical protein [Sphingomonas mali]|uniref:hypothetical protein n=1 Tax=Sphingomonas mali TaxID=40682 RepID=UPI00082E902C|nr:hypothetical protein [Sphingomonas mali]